MVSNSEAAEKLRRVLTHGGAERHAELKRELQNVRSDMTHLTVSSVAPSDRSTREICVRLVTNRLVNRCIVGHRDVTDQIPPLSFSAPMKI